VSSDSPTAALNGAGVVASPRYANTNFPLEKSAVLSALRELAQLADDARATSLARRLLGERIPHLEEERFHLVVLGEFNHGKTTFVNALLGAPVLPAGVTPTTAVIHHLVHGSTPAAAAVSTDGTRLALTMSELGDYVVGGKAARDDVRYVEVRHPASLLAGGVVLVDTPGVNDLNLSRAEITYSYIPRADAVIFLLDAGQILKESERAFLEQKLLAASRDKVLFVVNKIDLLTPAEREEALAYATTNLARLVPSPRVYAVSAQRALAGDRAGGGLEPFLTELTKFLADERGRILLDNALEDGLRAAATLRRSFDVQRHALALDAADLDRRVRSLESDLEGAGSAASERERRVRERLAAVKALVRRETVEFGDRFARALPAEIEAGKADELKKYLPGFIEERFRSFAEQQADDIAQRLEAVAEEAIAFLEQDARASAARLHDMLGPTSPELNLDVNTFAYDVGVFALGAFGIGMMALSNVLVGGALTLAAPVLAYVFRDRADKEVKRRASDAAPIAVREAAAKMADLLDERIDEFGDRLAHFVTSASDELTRSVAEVLRAASFAKTEGDAARDDLERRTGMSSVQLAAVTTRMEAQRNALWAQASEAGA
jgi:ribosome biogenesis GTPase A